MLYIDQYGNITMTRADTSYIEVTEFKNDDGTAYTLSQGDKIIFRLKSNQPLLEKELVLDLENNTAELTLEPSDTENMSISAHKYEMELVTSLNEHFTFVANKRFMIDTELEVHDGN